VPTSCQAPGADAMTAGAAVLEVEQALSPATPEMPVMSRGKGKTAAEGETGETECDMEVAL